MHQGKAAPASSPLGRLTMPPTQRHDFESVPQASPVPGAGDARGAASAGGRARGAAAPRQRRRRRGQRHHRAWGDLRRCTGGKQQWRRRQLGRHRQQGPGRTPRWQQQRRQRGGSRSRERQQRRRQAVCCAVPSPPLAAGSCASISCSGQRAATGGRARLASGSGAAAAARGGAWRAARGANDASEEEGKCCGCLPWPLLLLRPLVAHFNKLQAKQGTQRCCSHTVCCFHLRYDS